MYILTGLLFLLGYTALETSRYVGYIRRKNKYNSGRVADDELGVDATLYTRPGSYETHDFSVKAKTGSAYAMELLTNIRKQKNVVKNLRYITDNKKLEDVTREMMYTIIRSAIYLDDSFRNDTNYTHNMNNPNNMDDQDTTQLIPQNVKPINVRTMCDEEIDRSIFNIIEQLEASVSAELGVNFKFSLGSSRTLKVGNSKNFNHFKPGREPINPVFKPLPLLFAIRSIKIIGSFIFWLRGFVLYHGLHGLSFMVRRKQTSNMSNTSNTGSNSKRGTLMLIHGIGIGISPYVNFVQMFDEYDDLIMVELPNIGYGKYVDDYPTPDAINESIMDHLSTYHKHLYKVPSTDNNDSTNTLPAIDLMGHSYGTVIISYLLRDTTFINTINYRKIVLLDPVCFTENIFKLCHIAKLGIVDFISFERKSICSSVKDIVQTIERSIQFLVLFSDIDTQMLIKRTIFLHEVCFPSSLLGKNVYVVLAEHDMYVNVQEVHHVALQHETNCIIIDGIGHSDMVFNSREKQIVVDFIRKNDHDDIEIC
ncbi:alpha/beta hydrolase fold [Yasminevirus sp. GU-2018]|uniref:Alpha/beta hydrolase fold n=1 Tax=Yasminevirus sp. GU-2018 TaxID=2420051 RepID=A0A5K0U756_9VIRU|nr:alpha/beta hydrolase fold [Yasminevirus sp. GU-2018]